MMGTLVRKLKPRASNAKEGVIKTEITNARRIDFYIEKYNVVMIMK